MMHTSDTIESGYTMLEVVVALALLVGVLVPAVGVLVRVVLHDGADDRTVALALGQEAMERTLWESRFRDEQWTLRRGRWRIARKVEVQKDIVAVTIRVWRVRAATAGVDAPPLVELSTARLRPSDVTTDPISPWLPSNP